MPKIRAVRLVLYEQITQCHTEKIIVLIITFNSHTQIIVIEFYRHKVSSRQTKTAKLQFSESPESGFQYWCK